MFTINIDETLANMTAQDHELAELYTDMVLVNAKAKRVIGLFDELLGKNNDR